MARRWRRGVALALGFGVGAGAVPASDVDRLKRLNVEELMEVEVTSVSRLPMALAKAPSALQVITGWEIRRSGATSLPEALRLAGNLNVTRRNAHDWGISARGFNTELTNKLLVMIDGRAVYTPLWSGVRWDVQDYLLEDLDRIEVISGPGGALWGSNAVNGVINVTTKSAAETQGVFAEVGTGNQLEAYEAFRYGGRLAPEVFFRVYAKHVAQDEEVFADGRKAGDGTEMAQAGFRLDVESTAQVLTLQGDVYDGDEGVVGAGEGRVAGGNLLGRWSRFLGDGSELRLQVYYDRAFLRLPVAAGAFGPAGKFFDDLETYDVDFQHRPATASAHTVVWGAGYRFIEDDSRAAPTLGFEPASVTQELVSGFVQDQIDLGGGRVLTLGTKVEHTYYTGLEIEPSVRIQQDVEEDHLVWAAISRAVRTPSRIDRDLRQPSSGPVIFSGSDRFESETVIAYEAGWRGQLGQWLAGSVSAFFNDYRDVRSLGATPGTIVPLVIGNDVEGTSHGFEVAFDADVLPGWRLHGGYNYLRTDLRVRPGGTDLNNTLNETADPEHQFSIGSSFNLPREVELDLHFRWADTLWVNNGGQAGTVPSYAELNARIAVPLADGVEFSLVGRNLLHDHHPENGAPGAARVEIRRSVFGKVTWRY
jgi:Outer membrane receptor for ferrienterochelin and colicins